MLATSISGRLGCCGSRCAATQSMPQRYVEMKPRPSSLSALTAQSRAPGATPSGWKSSGLGTRHGAAGIQKYTKVQSLLVTKRALKREPFMFPYRAGRTRLLRRVFRLLYGRGKRD